MASVSGYLGFDPTDANTVAASATIGSYVLAGDDGTQIGSQNINSDDWLNTAAALFDGSGNAITSTGNALDVNIASGSLSLSSEYDEDTAHTSGDKGQFIMSVRVDDLTSVPAGALAGTELDYQALITGPNGELLVGANDLDIRDLDASQDSVQSNLYDGAGTALTSTLVGSDQALDVNVVGGDIDDDLANSAIENSSTSVSTTAVNMVTSALANRKWVGLANEGNKIVYFGKTGVTTANGFPMYKREKMIWRIGPSVAPQLIGATGASSEDIRVIELS